MAKISEQGSGQDAQLLQQVHELWNRVDPVPAGLTDRISYALTVQLLQAEVVELTRTPELLARSEPAEVTRSLTFAGSTVSLMVTVTPEADGLRLDCWVTQPGAVVQVDGAGGQRTEVTDEHGRLTLTRVAPGPTHFVVWPDANRVARPIITPIVDL